MTAQVPTERKKLVVAARTAPPKVLDIKPVAVSVKTQDSSATLHSDEDAKPKLNPFGTAKPRDEAEIARLYNERLAERKEIEKSAPVEKKLASLTISDPSSNWRVKSTTASSESAFSKKGDSAKYEAKRPSDTRKTLFKDSK